MSDYILRVHLNIYADEDGWSRSLWKDFRLPFAPFNGLVLLDSEDDAEPIDLQDVWWLIRECRFTASAEAHYSCDRHNLDKSFDAYLLAGWASAESAGPDPHYLSGP